MTSARQTATLRHAQGGLHRLVSLTRDFSVFIDLSGGRDLVNVLANGYYMHFALFVKGCKTINLAKSRLRFSAYRSLTDPYIRAVRL